jgi:phosphate transport system substrate-binding protein
MSKGKETTALLLTLLVTAGVAGGGYWYFQQSANNTKLINSQSDDPQSLNNPNNTPVSTQSNGVNLDISAPDPSVLKIDGSTTLVLPIRELRNAYAQLNPNIPTTFGVPDGKPGGTDKGIQNLINNSVVIAASSRPLKPDEAQAGIQLVPIAKDSIAIVIGSSNPFKGDLTLAQLRDIYAGKITNWSQVGGANLPIKVINRATTSGTRSLFQDAVMLGQPFALDSANFITWPQDETTAILRTIGNNGISYATAAQVANQEIVRIVSIEGKSPLDLDAVKSGTYPISRSLFLAVRKQTSPAVKQFVDLALSPQGQQTLQRLGFVPIR